MKQPKDQAYWDDFMRRQPRNPSMLGSVPVQFRTSALCEWLMQDCGDNASFVRFVPEAAFTRYLAEAALARSASLLAHVPARLIDKALCMSARAGGDGFSLAHVPVHVVDHELCVHALRCGADLAEVPPALLDKAMCMAAITLGGHALERIPAALVDDDLIAAAIAHGSYDSFNDGLPELFKSPGYLTMTIERYKIALRAIPGNRMTRELVDCACRVYGNDADWPAIVARHGESRLEHEPDAVYADVCWSAFWTEPVMLAQIASKKGEGLRPFEIPAGRFTKAVAQACAVAHPFHLDAIPARWIDQAMCQRVRLAYPDYPDLIPLEWRSDKHRLADAIVARDVDIPRFYLLVNDAWAFNQRGDFARALLQGRRAVELLDAAACADPVLRADATEQLRHSLNALGRHDQSDQLCREWLAAPAAGSRYDDSDPANRVRVARRACCLQLATRLAHGAAAPEALAQALALLDAGAAVEPGPGEDDDVTRPFASLRAALADRIG